LFSIFFVFTADFLERLKTDASSSGKMEKIAVNIKKDWQGIKEGFGSVVKRKKDGNK